jgi:hypothetical protein
MRFLVVAGVGKLLPLKSFVVIDYSCVDEIKKINPSVERFLNCVLRLLTDYDVLLPAKFGPDFQAEPRGRGQQAHL